MDTNTTAPDFITVDEAARLLRINRKTLYEVIRTQRPAWAIRFGKTIRINRSALIGSTRVTVAAGGSK